MDHLGLLACFARVAELSSFSAAARDLRTTQSRISRSVRQLEEHLGAQLLTRTTRRVALTPEGAEYLERARTILRAVESADESIGTRARSLNGRLRVFASVSLGRKWVVPRLQEFLHMHPRLEVELVLDDRRRDLVEERIDVALVVGPQKSSTAKVRLLGDIGFVLCASPRWLLGKTIRHPRDLENVESVIYDGALLFDRVTLESRGRRSEVALRGRFRTNSSDALLAAAVCGLGLLAAPRWLVAAELAGGALVEVLPRFRPVETIALFALVAPSRTPATARVERFIAFFAKALRADGLFENARKRE